MTSQDNQQYLTVEMFNAKMDAFMATIRLENEKLRNELHSEIKAVETEVKINSAKIADLQNSFAIYFGIATLIITFLAIVKGVLIAFAHVSGPSSTGENKTQLLLRSKCKI